MPHGPREVQLTYFAQTASLVGDPTVSSEMRAVSAPEVPDSVAAARLAARSAFYNAQLRTTCVATLLQGGHAENALPQMAQATVNCRMLPGTNPRDVDATIRRVIGDTSVVVASIRPAAASPPSGSCDVLTLTPIIGPRRSGSNRRMESGSGFRVVSVVSAAAAQSMTPDFPGIAG